MTRFRVLLIVAFIACFSTAVFADVIYLEQVSPAGEVAPPSSSKTAAKPYRNTNPESEVFSNAAVGSSGSTEPRLAEPLMSDAIVGTFQNAYLQQKSPRLLVFLNRSLSDEIREWRTSNRGVVAMQGIFKAETETKDPAGIAAYRQDYIENPARQAPADEGWMWGFEDAFINTFLEAGTSVVDRATVLRLTAAETGQQGDAFDPFSVKKVEIDAMRGKADLFLEILIRKNNQAKLGYDFKATAKEIETGLIKAHVTTRNWDYHVDNQTIRKVVANEQGYEFIDESVEGQLPDVETVSRDLALALMRSMMTSWGR